MARPSKKQQPPVPPHVTSSVNKWLDKIYLPLEPRKVKTSKATGRVTKSTPVSRTPGNGRYSLRTRKEAGTVQPPPKADKTVQKPKATGRRGGGTKKALKTMVPARQPRRANRPGIRGTRNVDAPPGTEEQSGDAAALDVIESHTRSCQSQLSRITSQRTPKPPKLPQTLAYLNSIGYTTSFVLYRATDRFCNTVPKGQQILKDMQKVCLGSLDKTREKQVEAISLPRGTESRQQQKEIADELASEDSAFDAFEKVSFWRTCQTIMMLSRENEEQNRVESAWNSSIHYRILDLALDEPTGQSSVFPIVAIPLRIKNKDLIPRSKHENLLVGLEDPTSKSSDYVILMPSDSEFVASLKQHCTQLERISINHVVGDESALRYPIAVTLETKRDTGGKADAQYQIAIWLHAQYRDLQLQFGDDVELPQLPVILVYGSQWFFYVAEMQESGLYFWLTHEEDLSSKTPRHLLIKCDLLRYLRDWALTKHKKWWTDNITALNARREAAAAVSTGDDDSGSDHD